jgi:hypothetical protein
LHTPLDERYDQPYHGVPARTLCRLFGRLYCSTSRGIVIDEIYHFALDLNRRKALTDKISLSEPQMQVLAAGTSNKDTNGRVNGC